MIRQQQWLLSSSSVSHIEEVIFAKEDNFNNAITRLLFLSTRYNNRKKQWSLHMRRLDRGVKQQQLCLHYTTTEKKCKMGISNKGLQTISTIQCSQMDQSIVRLLVQIRSFFTNVPLLMRKEFKTRIYTKKPINWSALMGKLRILWDDEDTTIMYERFGHETSDVQALMSRDRQLWDAILRWEFACCPDVTKSPLRVTTTGICHNDHQFSP